MDSTHLQFFAGVASSLLFVASNSFMLIKAGHTGDLKSYSLGYLAFANLGNLLYWVYVFGLPFGPIWFLHAFNTLVSGLMLLWFFRFEESKNPNVECLPERTARLCGCTRNFGSSPLALSSLLPFVRLAGIPAKRSAVTARLPSIYPQKETRAKKEVVAEDAANIHVPPRRTMVVLSKYGNGSKCSMDITTVDPTGDLVFERR